jgi:hypothetical protein
MIENQVDKIFEDNYEIIENYIEKDIIIREVKKE